MHRDIKPGNFLYSRGGLLKLTDFGISELAAVLQPHAQHSLAGVSKPTGGFHKRCAARGAVADTPVAARSVTAPCMLAHLAFLRLGWQVQLEHRSALSRAANHIGISLSGSSSIPQTYRCDPVIFQWQPVTVDYASVGG